MSSLTYFFIIVIILSTLFLLLNFLFAPHNPYQEKYSIFECGFHSFLGQNRTEFSIIFFFYGIVYLILDLEIVMIYPFSVSVYENDIYGLVIILIFILIITIGFIFELGKNALSIESRQNNLSINKNIYNMHSKNRKYFLYDKNLIIKKDEIYKNYYF